MDIYTIFMIAIVILNLLFLNKNIEIQSVHKKIYCFISGFLLLLISSLRGTSVGSDSWNYARMFSLYTNAYIQDARLFTEKDIGFHWTMKSLALLSSNHQILFFFIAFIFSISISSYIYKYSDKPMVSFLMLIPMSYFAFSLTGLRQTLAISITLYSYDFIKRKKLIKFICIIMLASLFHKSAILFLPAYFISNKKISAIKVLLATIGGVIVFSFRVQWIRLIQNYMYQEYSIDYSSGAGGWSTFLVYCLIILVALIFSKQIKNEDFQFFVKIMYIGALIQMFVPMQPNIFRVSMYYNITSIIIIPSILKTQKDKISVLIAYSLFFILMGTQYYVFTYNAAGVQPYVFFWQ